MPATQQTNVVVFAGAGASKALRETNFPTTIEFFNELPSRVRENQYFDFVESYLQNRKGENAVIDIEEVLLELQNLINFLRAANDASSIVGRAVAANLMATLQRGWNFGQLHSGGADLAFELEKLQGLINAQVYRFYSKEPTDSELEETWNPLLEGLLEKCWVDIFTTNYDLVIENSLESISSAGTMYKYLGARGRAQKHLDLDQWREEKSRAVGLLTKLHGSLNWKLSDDQILLGDWAFTGDHAKQAIIYPGFKGSSNAVFFDPFHEYLTRALARADYVLMIGFAFRDDVINQIFRSSLNAKASVVVMDPNTKLALPGNRKAARANRFDGDSVRDFLNLIR